MLDKPAHYNALLLEDIRHKMEMVIEATQATKVTLQSEMKELNENLTARMDTIEGVLRHHSVSIQKINTEIQKTNNEMHQMEGRLSEKLDKFNGQVDNHETRIARLETHVIP